MAGSSSEWGVMDYEQKIDGDDRLLIKKVRVMSDLFTCGHLKKEGEEGFCRKRGWCMLQDAQHLLRESADVSDWETFKEVLNHIRWRMSDEKWVTCLVLKSGKAIRESTERQGLFAPYQHYLGEYAKLFENDEWTDILVQRKRDNRLKTSCVDTRTVTHYFLTPIAVRGHRIEYRYECRVGSLAIFSYTYDSMIRFASLKEREALNVRECELFRVNAMLRGEGRLKCDKTGYAGEVKNCIFVHKYAWEKATDAERDALANEAYVECKAALPGMIGRKIRHQKYGVKTNSYEECLETIIGLSSVGFYNILTLLADRSQWDIGVRFPAELFRQVCHGNIGKELFVAYVMRGVEAQCQFCWMKLHGVTNVVATNGFKKDEEGYGTDELREIGFHVFGPRKETFSVKGYPHFKDGHEMYKYGEKEEGFIDEMITRYVECIRRTQDYLHEELMTLLDQAVTIAITTTSVFHFRIVKLLVLMLSQQKVPSCFDQRVMYNMSDCREALFTFCNNAESEEEDEIFLKFAVTYMRDRLLTV